ncbi:putative bifunctional diguanylate cyclase/phosphodiesterase [Sphingomonas adhaesiva]|uniref:putative bifunctional diguanylate cyclase/phosphodiesterase n=1 Tax=Sphingomonas adhaesiva TaxID=28212 RepID=UPI002FF93CD4
MRSGNAATTGGAVGDSGWTRAATLLSVILSFALVLLASRHALAMHVLMLVTPCTVIGWALAQRRLGRVLSAADAAVARLDGATDGDLASDAPATTHRGLPQLGHAMEALFRRLNRDMDEVTDRAARDPVTGLASRAFFRAEAERLLDHAPQEVTAALFFVDLDRFKMINDTRGHACGDKLLAKVAERLKVVATTACGDGALVGRLAGDEFTLLCPGVDVPDHVQAIGEAIVTALGAPFTIDDATISIGASVGVALRPQHGATLHELMGAADAAMYRSKAAGRARVSRYDARLAAELTDRDRLDHDLRGAVRRDEFALVFQPQVSLRDGMLVTSEALLRWRHPTLGLRPAAAFLARAEQTGQMTSIGDWVALNVAAAAGRWHRLDRRGRIALNVAQQQVEDITFFDRLSEAFATAEVPLDRLELELAEGVAMRCPPAALDMLEALRGAGAKVTVDDFGAGDSNVQRLRAFPVDRIKLDRMLVRDVAADADARTILQALVGLVHGLGCEAVAEGVESDAQVDVLRIIGCDAVQGYAVAHPMDEGALEAWIGSARPRLRAG